MKLLTLEVNDCDRLDLSGIKNIKFENIAGIMAFLGTNGSGKSSLLRMMSPLPADKADFGKEGYVIVRLEHNSVVYRLTSDFRKGAMYSFVVENNEEELNEGGTLTAQKQLVMTYFKYNAAIHNLLTGDEEFTEMNPKRRKEWFTLLCDCDYTYAIGVYNRIREKLRDSQGALKKQQQMLLAASTTEAPSEDSIDSIKATIALIEKEIEAIQRFAPYDNAYANFNPYDTNRLSDNIKDLVRQNNRHTQQQARGLLQLCDEDYTQRLLQETRGKIRLTEESIQAKVEQHMALSKRVESVKVVSSDESSERLKQIEAHRARITQIKQSVNQSHWTLPLMRSEEVVGAYRTNPELLVSLQVISGAGIRSDLRETYQKVQDEIASSSHALLGLKTHLGKIEGALETHARKVQEHKATCPECQHTFLFRVGEENIDSLKQSRNNLNRDIASLEKKQEDLKKDFEFYNEKIQILNHFNSFVVGNAVLMQPYMKVVMQNNIFYEAPTMLVGLMQEYIQVAEAQVEINKLQSLIDEAERLNVAVQTVDARHYEKMVEELLASEKVVSEMTNALVELKEEATFYAKQLDNTAKVKQTLSELADKTEALKERQILEMKMKLYHEGQSMIHQRRENISILSKRMVEIMNRESKIKHLEEAVNELIVEKDSWTVLEASLSPSDGAIALGLLGYIKIFVARLNGFINQIWTYPLLVKASTQSEEENNDLSYRFPIEVGDSGMVRKDVKNGSSGIKEVINLAFRITAMRALGLTGYPIFLDEFGRTFDEKHRENASRLIDKLVEEFHEDQIFMISHFYQQYSVMNDIVFCVIKEDNIVMPPINVNKDIVITR